MQEHVSGFPLVVELRPDRPGLAAGVKRLPAADFGRLQSSHAMLSSAERRAAEIVQQAEHVQEQARMRGLEQGRGEARLELLKAVADMQATLQKWVLDTEPQLVEMVLRCVHEIVKDHDPEALVQGSIGRALSEMAAATEIRIQVNDAHLQDIRNDVDVLVEQYALQGSIRVESSPMLKPGDCIVDSPLGTVDLRIESQLNFVDQTLRPG